MTQDILTKLDAIDALIAGWQDGTPCPGALYRMVEQVRQSIAKQQLDFENQLLHQQKVWQETVEEVRERKDAAYLERNQVVAALAKAYPSGIKKTAIEGWSEDWHGCVYIDLPTGQASWHYHDSQAYLFAGLPPYTGLWDGHTTEEKYRRLAELRRRIPMGWAMMHTVGRDTGFSWVEDDPRFDDKWQRVPLYK